MAPTHIDLSSGLRRTSVQSMKCSKYQWHDINQVCMEYSGCDMGRGLFVEPYTCRLPTHWYINVCSNEYRLKLANFQTEALFKWIYNKCIWRWSWSLTHCGLVTPYGDINLAQVIACCLTAPSHYLNQCWLIISKDLWHSSEGNFTEDISAINHCNWLEQYSSKISLKSPRPQWVKTPEIYMYIIINFLNISSDLRPNTLQHKAITQQMLINYKFDSRRCSKSKS